MVNKFLPYRPLKYIVKLSIKLNLYLYLFEWITCECQSLSRLFLLNNSIILFKKNKGQSLFVANGYNSYWKNNMFIYFGNLTIGVPVLHVLNMYNKFYVNQMLFIIWFINLFLMHNFRLQKLEI